MLNTLHAKLLIIIAALVATIAASLSYTAWQSHIQAVAAAAMEKRQADAEAARKKFEEDFRRAVREQQINPSSAAKTIQDWRLDTSYGRHADGKAKAR
jgi:hypothetical protein